MRGAPTWISALTDESDLGSIIEKSACIVICCLANDIPTGDHFVLDGVANTSCIFIVSRALVVRQEVWTLRDLMAVIGVYALDTDSNVYSLDLATAAVLAFIAGYAYIETGAIVKGKCRL